MGAVSDEVSLAADVSTGAPSAVTGGGGTGGSTVTGLGDGDI